MTPLGVTRVVVLDTFLAPPMVGEVVEVSGFLAVVAVVAVDFATGVLLSVPATFAPAAVGCRDAGSAERGVVVEPAVLAATGLLAAVVVGERATVAEGVCASRGTGAF